MTMTSTIAIVSPMDAEEVFMFARSLLRGPGGRTPDELGVPIKRQESHREGCLEIWNRSDSKLDALLWVVYGVDGPIRPHEYDEPDYVEFGGHPNPAILVDFDTALHYRGPEGEGVRELHARLVHQLSVWLEERSAEYHWQKEYTGEWFSTPDTAPLLTS